MSRTRSIPDTEIYKTVLHLLCESGEKAVSFATVAAATGLAAPTLVQRYGSIGGMLAAALAGEWDRLEALTTQAVTKTPVSPKGAQSLLKALAHAAPAPGLWASVQRSASLRSRAEAWRQGVEAALAHQLGGGTKAQEEAVLLFAAWQGQILWQGIGERRFKLKDAVRRLG